MYARKTIADHGQGEKGSSSNVSLHPLQCRLSVGPVDDPLEDEADATADKVMRMTETNFIQRKCAHCEEEEKAQRKPLASFVQKKEPEADQLQVKN